MICKLLTKAVYKQSTKKNIIKGWDLKGNRRFPLIGIWQIVKIRLTIEQI